MKNGIVKEWCCRIYNLKNGIGWKHGISVRYGNRDVLLSHIRVKNRGKHNLLYLGKGCRLQDIEIVFSGDHNQIIIGDGCSINRTGFYLENQYNEIRIGDGTTTTANVSLSAIEGTKIIIGKDCMLSSDVDMATGDGHGVLDDQRLKRINESQDIIIEDHVWIGHKTIINKGVHIASDSIVAAGSVLVRQRENTALEKNVVWGGNPARIVKQNIDWDRDREVGRKK